MEGWDVPVQKWVGDGIWCTARKREDIDFSVGRRKRWRRLTARRTEELEVTTNRRRNSKQQRR
jgi:hypothetical protein